MHILLRSSWQAVNIGDIAHTPGALAVFESQLPEAEITLWPSSVALGVRELLLRRFPRLRIAEGDVDADGRPQTPELAEAFARCDVLVHGSGPALMAHAHIQAWQRQTGKPFGFFGITCDPLAWGGTQGSVLEGGTLPHLHQRIAAGVPALDAVPLALLRDCAFAYFRDSMSLAYVRSLGFSDARFGLGPDATVNCDLRADAAGDAYAAAHGLEDRSFLCVVPRLRYTPYHQIHGTPPTALDLRKAAISQQHRETDHAKLREVIIAWVRTTGLPVLACPEMTYEMALARESLIDPLPGDVRAQVVWRSTYWLPDEANSIYAKASAVVSFECHSPLLALAQGTPALYLRQPTDTIKGQMYHDLGLGSWTGEIDELSGSDIAERVLAIHRRPDQAQEVVRRFRAIVTGLQQQMVASVASAAAGPRTAKAAS